MSERTAEQWWAWHDEDASRWSGGEDPDEATRDAEARCAAWVAGESTDGPDRVMGRERFFCAGKGCPGLSWRASDLPHPSFCSVDPERLIGAQVVMWSPNHQRNLLGDVRSYQTETSIGGHRVHRLCITFFNGEPWPIQPEAWHVKPLSRAWE